LRTLSTLCTRSNENNLPGTYLFSTVTDTFKKENEFMDLRTEIKREFKINKNSAIHSDRYTTNTHLVSAWICIVFLAAMYAKLVQNVMRNQVRPYGSLPLHSCVIYNVFWPSQILL
jgi:hypothetical protein